MTVTELATLLEQYDRDELVYVVLVEHQDGELELLGWDGEHAYREGAPRDAVINALDDPSVLVPHDEPPVTWPCDVVARTTRLELHNACPRCAS